MALASTSYFDHFPAEVRSMIFKEAMATKEDASNLIAALLPFHRNGFSTLYTEALHINYAMHPCTLKNENMGGLEKLSEKVKESVKNLVVEFTLVETVKQQRVLSCKLDPFRGAIASTETINKPLTTIRISPKPSYLLSVQPFPNLKRLRLESEMIGPKAFHQVEGMLTLALKSHRHLERIEIRSDMSHWSWLFCGEANDEYTRGWVGRVNAGTGVLGKMTRATTYSGEECWFWQAAAGQTLSWKAATTVPCLKRKAVELVGNRSRNFRD